MRIDILTLFPDAVDAMMHASVLGRAQERGYIAIRTHQIRAHLADSGHPILGDYKYGSRAFNEKYRGKYGLKSQLLHAYRLEIPQIEGTLSYLSDKSFLAKLPPLFEKILKEEHIEENK